MRIAIDARGINWYKGTGIGTYTENILKNILTLDSNNHYQIYWAGKNYREFKKQNSKIILTSNKHTKFFEEHYFPSNLMRDSIDIFHMPQNGVGLNPKIKCTKVVTIHDLIPYVMPETVGKGYLIKFLKEVPASIQASKGIITVSDYSKKDILKFFPINPDKIFVTPLAADIKYKIINKKYCQEYLRKNYNIEKPFILYIGGFSPRKNVKSLIRSFSKIYYDLNEEYNLVIIGATNKDQYSSLHDLGINLNISNNIIFTNYVPEEDLPIFYNACKVFVYPSLYEGFGLPLLEAMNCGAPVISSNVTSIPEVVGDAGILIDPHSDIQLNEAISSVLSNNNLRNHLILKGLERAKIYNWETTSINTIKVYESLQNSC